MERKVLLNISKIFGVILLLILKEQTPKRGDDVHLTLDSNIQVFVEEALDGMVENMHLKIYLQL